MHVTKTDKTDGKFVLLTLLLKFISFFFGRDSAFGEYTQICKSFENISIIYKEFRDVFLIFFFPVVVKWKGCSES